MYYKSTITGHIMSEGNAKTLDNIYGKGKLEQELLSGVIIPIENPSVMECLKNGNKITAVMRYREIHNCSLLEAKKEVDALAKEMMH